MKNRMILLGGSVLAWFGLSKVSIAANEAVNREVLKREKLWPQGGYIARQSALGALRFGKSFTMAYGGCGLIALYNALVALGEKPSNDVFLELAADLQRKGVAWFGKYGIHPAAIRRWLVKHGYLVKRLRISEESFVQNVEDYKVFIVTVMNGTHLRELVHTVCITREVAGFVVHNGPSEEAYATFQDAVRRSSRQGATAIYAMGVGKRQIGS